MAPKPMEYPEVVMEEAVCQGSSRKIRSSKTYMPRSWRWLEGKQAANKCLAKVIEKKAFCFKHYSYTLRGITKSQLSGKEMRR